MAAPVEWRGLWRSCRCGRCCALAPVLLQCTSCRQRRAPCPVLPVWETDAAGAPHVGGMFGMCRHGGLMEIF